MGSEWREETRSFLSKWQTAKSIRHLTMKEGGEGVLNPGVDA